MISYPTYLLIVNAFAFLLFTIGFHICMRTGREEFIDHGPLSTFSLFGGGGHRDARGLSRLG